MKKLLSLIALIAFYVLMFNSFGQNVILLHKKAHKENYFIYIGNNLKVKTIYNNTFKGRITDIKDSSFIITSNKFDNKTTEIPIKDIKFIYYSKKNASKILFGSLLSAIPATIALVYVLGDVAFNQMDESQTATDPSIIPVAIAGAGLTVLVFHAIFHRREFDLKNTYDISIMKPKPK